VANTAWYLFNFRLNLMKGLLNSGYEVVAIAPEDDTVEKLQQTGCQFFNLKMDNKGLNPFADFRLKKTLEKIYEELSPDLVVHYTIKPVIYGSLTAAKLGIPFVNNITGLGTAFIKKNWVTWFVKRLYRLSQKNADHVFFQNSDDKELFRKNKLIPENVPQEVIPGTGIDTIRFFPKPYPKSNPDTFLLIARLIWDKGVGEFVEAAKKIKSEFSDVRFQLLGFLDVKNRTAISHEQVQKWNAEGIIDYLGDTEDVRPYIEKAGCIVLPSYREGLPRTLLEAAAMARPIIATDVTGCREVVQHGLNGYLCKVKSAIDLAEKMKDMIKLSTEERGDMGLRGRKKMEQKFDEKIIVKKIFNRIEDVLNVT